MRKPIYLLGFMGSGKSVVGKRLSCSLAYNYIDLDQFIESKEGNSISTIFATQGEKYFRDLEHSYLLEISNKRNIIISLGGGTPCFSKNRRIIAKGTTVYLKGSIASLTDRLFAERQKRPLIQDISSKKPLANFISDLLRKRKIYYQSAEIKVWNRGDIDKVIDIILKKLSL